MDARSPESNDEPSPARAPRRSRRLRTKLGLLLASTVVFLLLSEVAVRLLSGDKLVLFPRYHTAAQYGEYRLRRLRPSSVFRHTSIDGSWEFVTNSRGFREEREYDYKKPAGTTRILCLGDSHTQGFEVRQDRTYARVVERYLARRSGPVEVINAGISGFGTAEELAFLENEGVLYHPDYVVLGFFANDVEDNVKSDLFRLKDGELVVQKTENVPGVGIQDFIYRLPATKWLGEHSYFYSLAFNSAWDLAKRRKLERARSSIGEDAPRGLGDPSMAVAAKDAFSAYEIGLAAKLIERMHAFCRTNGIRLVILDVPRVDVSTGETRSSIPPELLPVARASCEQLVLGEDELADFEGVTNLHVPHGQRHISELTHCVLGIAVAKRILAEL